MSSRSVTQSLFLKWFSVGDGNSISYIQQSTYCRGGGTIRLFKKFLAPFEMCISLRLQQPAIYPKHGEINPIHDLPSKLTST